MTRYLITGATSGLGHAVCGALRDGALGPASLIVCMGRDEVRLAAMTAAWAGVMQPAVCDMAAVAPERITHALRGLAQEGGALNGIVHCAGVEVVAPLRLTGDAQYRAAMMAADSAFAILRAAACRGVMVDGGSIVIMSSVAAHRGTAGMAAYSAGKAAIEAMVRCAAIELAPRGIRVNAIAAGAFRSPMHTRITRRMPPGALADYDSLHPLGIGSVSAVSDAVLHLLSDAAQWVTGTTMVVDGGLLA